jgi:hypothetical protein
MAWVLSSTGWQILNIIHVVLQITPVLPDFITGYPELTNTETDIPMELFAANTDSG